MPLLVFSPLLHCSLHSPIANSVDPRNYSNPFFDKSVDLRKDKSYDPLLVGAWGIEVGILLMMTDKEIVLDLYAAFDRGEFDRVRAMMSADFSVDLVESCTIGGKATNLG